MNPSVRMVCGGCLRSVELPANAGGLAANLCPHCGGVIDSEASRVDSPRVESDTTATNPDAARTRARDSIDWAKTWDRGSFGTLGRFQLRERLGEGGFGEVFLAYDPRLDRDVAVKVLKQADPNDRVMGRFFREARAVARLDHPNIVSVHDAGFDNGRCWVAYQHVAGQPLWLYRNQHDIDPLTAARMIRDLADGLEHAHRMGVVHRNIKPANVIIDDRGRPRLIDFGLARRCDIESDLTRDDGVIGTPLYMSPEQAIGRSREADERTDVYSLGVILLELLGGRIPTESNTVSTSRAIRGSSAGVGFEWHIGQHRKTIPAGLLRICIKAMAEDPAARYPRARAMAEELGRWLRDAQTSGRRWRSTLVGLTIGLAVPSSLLTAFLPNPFVRSAREESAEASTNGGSAAISSAPPTSDAPALRSSTPRPDGEAGRSRPGATDAEIKARLVGNRETRMYHRVQCAAVQSMAERNHYDLRSARQADDEGFRACDKCHPPVFRRPPTAGSESSREGGRAARSREPPPAIARVDGACRPADTNYRRDGVT